MLRCNVDLTRALQISFTLADAKGNLSKGVTTWRFNFMFDPNTDFFVQESLDLFSKTLGVDLGRHSRQGIASHDFGDLMMSSGIVLSDTIKWITFCGTASLSEAPPSLRRGADRGSSMEPPERRFSGLYSFGFL